MSTGEVVVARTPSARDAPRPSAFVGVCLALLATTCTPFIPALGSAGELEDAAEQACASDDLFADVPVEAMVIRDELWVRGAGGTLASLRPGSDTNTISYHLEHERVVDLFHASNGALWALAVADVPGDVRIWQRAPGGWMPIWEMGAPSDAMALVELGGWPAVVTPQRIYVATGELWTQELSPPLPSANHYQAVARGSSIWVTARGVGWLYHVDAKTGATRGVADIRPEPCSGLLDPSCDVISDLDVDARRVGCALVTTRGRVLRVCPDEKITQAKGVVRAVRAEWAQQIRALAMLFPDDSASRAHLMSLVRADNPMRLARRNLVDDLPKLDDDPIEALATTREGYVALGSQAMYRVEGRRNDRVQLPPSTSRCGLEVTRTDDAIVINASQPLPLMASLDVPSAPPTETLTAPPPPCEDTVIFYARGDASDGGDSVVLRCEEDAVTMVMRAVPHDRFFSVPTPSWRALWADLERAQWRAWKGCDPTSSAGSKNDRFMISTASHTLQVDCPRALLNNHQRAVLERLHTIFEQTRRRDQTTADVPR